MRWRQLGLLVGGTALALLLAEFLLGGPLRSPLHTTRSADWQAVTQAMHAALYQADPTLVYVPRPGARVDMDFGVAAFNDQGLRASGHIGPPSERTRVVLVGDSLVWGAMLAPEDTVGAALERTLGAGHEVVNAGVSGYDTAQEAGWYLRAVRGLQPDAVVVVYCLNDMLVQSGPAAIYGGSDGRDRHDRQQAWLDAQAPLRNETVQQLWWRTRGGEGSQVLAAVAHAWRWHRLFTLPGGYVDDYLLAARDPNLQTRTADALHTLGAAIRADGARPVLVVSPALYWWHRYQWDPIHTWVAATAAAAGFQIVEPLDEWRDEDPDAFRFEGDNLHYTPYGAERLAEVIARALVGAEAAGRVSAPPG